MVELLARLAVAVVLSALTLTLHGSGAQHLWQPILICAAVGAFGTLLGRRGVLTTGIAGWIAVIESACIAFWLAQTGWIGFAGFVALLPLVVAHGYRAANAQHMAPLVAAGIMASANLSGLNAFDPMIATQGLGALLLGLLLGAGRAAVAQEPVAEKPKAEQSKDGYVSAFLKEPPETLYEMRKEIRELKRHAKYLEAEVAQDKLINKLRSYFDELPEGNYSALARAIKEAIGAGGVTLWTASNQTGLPGGAAVVQASAGSIPERAKDHTFSFEIELGDAQIKHRLEKAIGALRDPGRSAFDGSVLLRLGGRLLGMVCVHDASPAVVRECVENLEGVQETISKVVQRLQVEEGLKRRLSEAELLYLVSAIGHGAASKSNLAARIVRELHESFQLEHIAIWWLDGAEATCAASKGAKSRLFEVISFAGGTGTKGWLEIGSPVIDIPNVAEDMRIDRAEAAKHRLGSYLIVPILVGGETVAMLTAGTRNGFTLSAHIRDMLFVVASETGLALGKVDSEGFSTGVASPNEFFEQVRASASGQLVYIEFLRYPQLIADFGAAAIENAARRLTFVLRSRLPQNSLICRRSEGDYIVLLRDADAEDARKWAAEIAAEASLITLTTPDGRARIPLALRAKVTASDQQLDRISA